MFQSRVFAADRPVYLRCCKCGDLIPGGEANYLGQLDATEASNATICSDCLVSVLNAVAREFDLIQAGRWRRGRHFQERLARKD